MFTIGVIVALVMGAICGVVFGLLTGSVGVGIVIFIGASLYAFYQAILGMGDANRATQHYRDQEIIDAIKDLKDKE